MANIPSILWDESSPSGSQVKGLGDNRIRELKSQLREVIALNHKMESSGAGSDWGKHKQLDLIEQADLGTGATGYCILGAQTIGAGAPELVFTDEADNDVQLTDSGESFGFRSGDLLMSSNTNTPSGFSDVSSTYADKFIRISSGTPLNTGGSDSHNHGGSSGNHTLTVSEMPSHTHSYEIQDQQTHRAGSDNSVVDTTNSSHTSGSTGGDSAHNHSISSVNNIPGYVQVKVYQKS